jgi:hypothetical protein
MKYIPPTIGYFLRWVTFYGFALGAWSTTMMFPVMGTAFGLVWGPGIGLACGLLCGLLASVIKAFTFHPDIDLPVYRARLSIIMGVLVGITAPIFLNLSAQFVFDRAPSFHIVSLVAAAFWGSLSAAYVGHGYPLWLAHSMLGEDQFSAPRLGIWDTVEAIVQSSMVRIVMGVGGIMGIVIGASDVVRYALSGDTGVPIRMLDHGVWGGIMGLVAGFFLLMMLFPGAAALIVFLKRLLFSSDVLSTSSHTERITLTTAAALFTGAVCTWPFILSQNTSCTRWFFPIFGTLLMGFYVYRALPTDLDKAKRKEKES